MDLIILIPLGLVALVGAYLCYHFIFHRNEPHDFWSHTSKVDPDDSHRNQEPHIKWDLFSIDHQTNLTLPPRTKRYPLSQPRYSILLILSHPLCTATGLISLLSRAFTIMFGLSPHLFNRSLPVRTRVNLIPNQFLTFYKFLNKHYEIVESLRILIY